MMQIVLYGAGKRLTKLINIISESDTDVVAIFDSDPSKTGKKYSNIEVISNERIEEYNKLDWCITVANEDQRRQIQTKMLNSGFDSSKQVQYNTLLLKSLYRTSFFTMVKNQSGEIMRTKILLGCTNGLILGGVEARTVLLCNELVNRGYDNAYILSDSRGYTIEIPEIVKPYIIKTDIGDESLSYLDDIKILYQAIINNSPCVVVTNSTGTLLLASYLARNSMPDEVKIISNVAGLTNQLINEYASYGEYSDLYIGVSEDIVKALKERGIPSDTIEHILVPFYCNKELLRSYSSIDTPVIIGYAGRLDGMEMSQKRMDLILKLIEELMIRKVNYIFNIAGDGSAREAMENTIMELGLKEKVRFWGYIPKRSIMSFWEKQDIAVNMADYEGRSISVAEAMGGGAVPVVTDTSGVREDIVDGVNGYILPTGDYITAADRIEYLYNNREIIPRMGKKAHEEIWPKSKIDVYVDKWETLIEQFSVLNR